MAATPFVLRRGRLIAAIVGLAILYVLAGKLGLSLAVVNSSTTAVWPPTGIAIAALLLFGVRLWPGVLLGALLIAPAILVWATDRQGILARPVEKLALAFTTVGSGILLFGGTQDLSINREPLAFLTFPVLVWAAARFGPRGTTAVLLLVAAIADWGTLRGFGPFARGDVNSSLLFLQAFMTVEAIT